MSRRDSYMLVMVALVGLTAAFWFLMLAPKRKEVSELDSKVAASETALQSAKQEAEQFAQARLDFPTDYTTVARLGKAVPADPDIPSLVVQLDRAANKAGVDFRKLTSESGSGTEATPPAPAPAPSGDAAAGATGASGATGATGATGSDSAGTTGAAGSISSAPANALLTPTMPLGVDIGPAGLSVAKFSFEFQGSFFRMADLLGNVRSLVQRRNRQLAISGRLVTIEGIAMVKGNKGFPQVGVTMSARAYLLPVSQGLFAGATAQGPANASAATPSPPASANPSAPPAAVVSPQ